MTRHVILEDQDGPIMWIGEDDGLVGHLRRDLDMPELSGSRLALLTVAAAVLVGLVYGFVVLFVVVMAPLLGEQS